MLTGYFDPATKLIYAAGAIVGLIGAWLIYRLFVKVSGYKRVEHVTHVYAPIWVGLLTIAGMLVYAGIRILL